MKKNIKRNKDTSIFGKEHKKLLALQRQNNKRDTLIQLSKLKRAFPRRGKPHWVGDYKKYPVSNIYYSYGISPPKVMDKDQDRVVNWEDCNPNNKNEQGFLRTIIDEIRGRNKTPTTPSPSLGTIYLKPSEASKAPSISRQAHAQVQVVGGSVSKPRIISTTTYSGGRTTTHSGGGSGISSRINLSTAKEVQAEARRKAERLKQLKEAQKLAEARRQAEKVRNIQFAINQEKSNKVKLVREAELRKQIEALRRKTNQAKNKTEFNKYLAQRLKKQKELELSKTGITNYNKKVTLENLKAQKEYDSFYNQTLKDLQSKINSGSMSVNQANKILKQRSTKKLKEINKKLNSKINSIAVPKALLKPVGTVQSVKSPKGVLEKGIFKLKNIPVSKTTKKSSAGKLVGRGLKEAGIGVGLGLLNFVRDMSNTPGTYKIDPSKKTSVVIYKKVRDLIKNPKLVKQRINQFPKEIKTLGLGIGTSLKLSPTRTVTKIGTEIFLMGRGGEVLGKVSESKRAKLSSKIDELGTPKEIELKIKRGKNPEIRLRENNLKLRIKPLETEKNINLINRDIKKLIPKETSKLKVKNLEKLSERKIKSYLKDKRLVNELIRKYPEKRSFTFKDIKTTRSYAKLKTAIKRDAFKKLDVKPIRKPSKVVKEPKRSIKGIKVSKSEYKSYITEKAKLEKINKGVGKFVRKIKNKGGVGKVENIPRKPISLTDFDKFRIGKKIPKTTLKNVKKVSATTFTQKFSAESFILKRFGNLKKGFWKIIPRERNFYQNTVAFQLYGKGDTPLGTIAFKDISSKPINRFRTLQNALKWGSNKEVVFSKLEGKNFVRSFVLKSRGNKITSQEFLSNIKIKPNGEFQDLEISTRKRPKYTSKGNIKSQFKESIPVSKTVGRIEKGVQKGKSYYDKKKGVLVIKQLKKPVKIIKTKSFINPTIIDTSKIETLNKELKLLKDNTFEKIRVNKLRRLEKIMKDMKKSRPFEYNGKKKILVSKSSVNKLEKINLEAKKLKKEILSKNKIRNLKESLSTTSIPPEVKNKMKIEGIKDLKKLKEADKALRDLKTKLIERNLLDAGLRLAITQALTLSNKMQKAIISKKRSSVLTKTGIKKAQKKIQASLQKSKSKTGLKLLSNLRKVQEIPIILPPIVTPRIPRSVLSKKKKRIITPRRKKPQKTPVESKKNLAYNVYIKSGSRWVKANTRPLSRINAENRRAYVINNTTAVTGRIVPVSKTKKLGIITSKESGARKRIIARNYKIVKGKKVKLQNTIIERRGKPRINRRGEVKGLTAARLIKKLKESETKKKGVKKKKTKKTSKRKNLKVSKSSKKKRK